MSKPITPAFWNDAKTYLRKKDKTLKRIIDSYHGEMMVTRGDAFFTLTRAIVGQQISVKAADSIFKRVEEAVGKIKPENIANTPAEVLRPRGLSAAKVLYLHSLANHFLENKKTIKRWPEMDDEALIKELSSIKGIGRWSAEMFLMFHLARPDVFPLGDLGLLKGIYRHYNDSNKMTLAEVRAIGERWKPYRSVATWYMWRVLDPLPVGY